MITKSKRSKLERVGESKMDFLQRENVILFFHDAGPKSVSFHDITTASAKESGIEFTNGVKQMMLYDSHNNLMEIRIFEAKG